METLKSTNPAAKIKKVPRQSYLTEKYFLFTVLQKNIILVFSAPKFNHKHLSCFWKITWQFMSWAFPFLTHDLHIELLLFQNSNNILARDVELAQWYLQNLPFAREEGKGWKQDIHQVNRKSRKKTWLKVPNFAMNIFNSAPSWIRFLSKTRGIYVYNYFCICSLYLIFINIWSHVTSFTCKWHKNTSFGTVKHWHRSM